MFAWALWLCVGVADAAPEMIPVQDADVVGRTAPPIELPLKDGGTFRLDEQRGTPVVLSFWASWCGPCRQELPALSELAKTRKDVAFYAVNVDKDPKLAERFLAQVRFELPIVLDPDAVALGQYDVLSMPTMFVVDRNGTVKWRKVGFNASNGLSELVAVLDGGTPR